MKNEELSAMADSEFGIMQEEYRKQDAVKKSSGHLYGFGDGAQLFEPTAKGEPTYAEQKRYKNGVTVSLTRGARPQLRYSRACLRRSHSPSFRSQARKR